MRCRSCKKIPALSKCVWSGDVCACMCLWVDNTAPLVRGYLWIISITFNNEIDAEWLRKASRRQDISSAAEFTCLCLQHIDTGFSPDHQKLWESCFLSKLTSLSSLLHEHHLRAMKSKELQRISSRTESDIRHFTYGPFGEYIEFSACLKAALVTGEWL